MVNKKAMLSVRALISNMGLLLCLTNISQMRSVWAQDMEVCKLWREGGTDYWSSQPTYCCKDCCLITLTPADSCTKDKCRSCPKGEEGQCDIIYD